MDFLGIGKVISFTKPITKEKIRAKRRNTRVIHIILHKPFIF